MCTRDWICRSHRNDKVHCLYTQSTHHVGPSSYLRQSRVHTIQAKATAKKMATTCLLQPTWLKKFFARTLLYFWKLKHGLCLYLHALFSVEIVPVWLAQTVGWMMVDQESCWNHAASEVYKVISKTRARYGGSSIIFLRYFFQGTRWIRAKYHADIPLPHASVYFL